MNTITVEWRYSPADFFEDKLDVRTPDATLVFDAGRVTAELRSPTEMLPAEAVTRLVSTAETVLRARQLVHHQPFRLEQGHSLVRVDAQGHRHITMAVAPVVFAGESRVAADITVRGPDGSVVRDTRAERIAEHTALIQQMADTAARSPLVARLLMSYSAAVSDPENELVHLYEIRDALQTHFGDGARARAQLGLSVEEWDALGVEANTKPLKQGRHRGKHGALRTATHAELEGARRIALRLILAAVEDTSP